MEWIIRDVIIIFWIHFVADFLLQTNYTSMNKNKNIYTLLLHCFIYFIPLLWFGFTFAIINAGIHFIIDFVTSKINRELYKIGKTKLLLNVIGLDQAIHMTTLVLTYWLIPKG